MTDSRVYEEFERAMVALHYSSKMFNRFLAEGEWVYYDAVATAMFDAWQAGRPAPVPVPWEQRVQLGQSTMRELARAQDAEIAEWRALASARG